MKTCTTCHIEKPEEEFNWLFKGVKRQYKCRECRAEARRADKRERGLTTLQKEKKIRDNYDKDAELFNQLNRMWR